MDSNTKSPIPERGGSGSGNFLVVRNQVLVRSHAGWSLMESRQDDSQQMDRYKEEITALTRQLEMTSICAETAEKSIRELVKKIEGLSQAKQGQPRHHRDSKDTNPADDCTIQ